MKHNNDVKTVSIGLKKLEALKMKRLLMICFAVLMLCQATAFAANTPHFIPKEELCIGGISLDCTLGYVKEIYGEPKEVTWKEKGKAGSKMGIVYYIMYKYSDTFIVEGKLSEQDSQGENGARIVSIYIQDNSLSTPSGITVGMPYSAVVDMFGERHQMTYNGRVWYPYAQDRAGIRLINFYVDDTNTITAINVYSQH